MPPPPPPQVPTPMNTKCCFYQISCTLTAYMATGFSSPYFCYILCAHAYTPTHSPTHPHPHPHTHPHTHTHTHTHQLEAPIFITLSQCIIAAICFLVMGFLSSQLKGIVVFPAPEYTPSIALKVHVFTCGG